MNKIFLLIIVSLLIFSSVQAMNYPRPFIGDTEANVLVVYPKNGDTNQLIAAAEIHINLQVRYCQFIDCPKSTNTEMYTPNYQTIIVSDNETNLFGGYNIISIGLNCENKVSNSILGLNEDCSNFEEKVNFTGGYLIKIMQSPYNSSKIAMIVVALDNNLLKNATKFITSNNFSTDIGTEIREIKTPLLIVEPPIANVSFFQRIINWFKELF